MEQIEAEVFKITLNREKTGYILYVKCPFCDGIHKHGENLLLNRRYFGTRMSHCFDNGKREYLLVRACTIPEL